MTVDSLNTHRLIKSNSFQISRFGSPTVFLEIFDTAEIRQWKIADFASMRNSKIEKHQETDTGGGLP